MNLSISPHTVNRMLRGLETSKVWEEIRMDKRKVITAYQRGIITIQECAQILGMDSPQIVDMMNESALSERSHLLKKQSVGR